MEVNRRQSWESVSSDFFPNEFEFSVLESLPFIAYAVDAEGYFYWCNQKCLDFFGTSDLLNGTIKIAHFYNSPQDREDFWGKLKKKGPGEWLSNTLLDLKINGDHQYLKDYSRMVSNKKGEIIGLVSIMTNVTQEERYHQLFEHLPIGIFRFLDSENGLVSANEKFVKMHGYENFSEIRHAKVGSFISEKENAINLIEEIKAKGKLEKRHVKHKKKDGSIFLGSINAIALFDESGNYLGTEGTLVDVTTEGLYAELINLVPIGLFKVELNKNQEHIIVHCNDAFAKNLGFQSHKELINKDIRKFHISEDAFEQYYKRVLQNDAHNIENQDYIVERFNEDGELFEYQIYTRLEKDSSNKIIGRVGAQREVTNEHKLEKRIKEITSDIGQVLHAYSTTLVMAKTNFEAVIDALSSKKRHFNGEIFLEDAVLAQIDQSIKSIKSLVHKFHPDKKQEFINSDLEELFRLSALFREVSGQDTVNQYSAQNNLVASKIIELLTESEFFQSQKEKTRQLRQSTEELIRNTSIIFLNRGLEGVLEMEAPVINLRSYLIDGVKPQEEPALVDVYDLFLYIVKSLLSYAASRGIEIKYHLREIQNIYILGYELELRRAFTNLLHNAIKYSWTRKLGEPPYIEIRVKKEGDSIIAIFSNRGVGISRKELTENRLFEFGYRGEKSSDRRRPGTGIGLHDAKKVIGLHKGSIEIDSRPTYGNPEIDNFNIAYLTTVTCKIPINPPSNAI